MPERVERDDSCAKRLGHRLRVHRPPGGDGFEQGILVGKWR